MLLESVDFPNNISLFALYIDDDIFRAAAGFELYRPVGDAGGHDEVRIFSPGVAIDPVVANGAEEL